MKEFFVSLTFSWCKRRQKALPAVCPNCNQRPSTYVYPGDDMDKVVGLICNQCSKEWFQHCYLSTNDRHRKRLDYIYHCGIRFFQASPTAPSEAPDFAKVRRMDHLNPGDHVCWPKLVATHHAIVVVVGNNQYTVIHFTKSDNVTVNRKCQIKQESISYWDHRSRGSCYRVNYNRSILYDKKVIISRAQFMYQNRQNIPYRLLHYNCESLATFCATGVAKTYQGERAVSFFEQIPGFSTARSLFNSI